MSVNHEDFADFAKDCLLRGGEIYFRNAASRAYYSGLHLARDHLPDEFKHMLNDHGKESHSKLIEAYKAFGRQPAQGRTQAKQISIILARMKNVRKRADYALDDGFELDDAEDNLDDLDEMNRQIMAMIKLRNP